MNCRSVSIGRLSLVRQSNVRVRSFNSSRQCLRKPHRSTQPLVSYYVTEGRHWSQHSKTQSLGSRAPTVEDGDDKHTTTTTGSDQAETDLNFVIIPIDNKAVQFSPILLRDMCECAACLDSSSKQKFFATPEIPAGIQARELEITKSGVGIKWNADIPGWDEAHTTKISWKVLRSIGKFGFAERPFTPEPQTLWDAAMFNQSPDIDYEAYMQDDPTLYEAVHQLHTHGILFISNVPETETSVSTIGERIGPLKNTFYGYTWDVRSVPEAKNVANTAQNLGFHMDLMYMEQPPHLQLLHCIRSSAQGGASTFTDSFRAALDLFAADRHAFETLCSKFVTFQYNHPTSHLYRQQRPVIKLGSLQTLDGRIVVAVSKVLEAWENERKAMGAARNESADRFSIQALIDAVSWSPPFQGPFSLRTPQRVPHRASGMLNSSVRKWHEAAKKFHDLIHRPEGVYERMMRPGECVIFDNRRVLHGRKEFEVGDAGTERWLRGAYLDKDPYMSKFQVLSRKFGKLSS